MEFVLNEKRKVLHARAVSQCSEEDAAALSRTARRIETLVAGMAAYFLVVAVGYLCIPVLTGKLICKMWPVPTPGKPVGARVARQR